MLWDTRNFFEEKPNVFSPAKIRSLRRKLGITQGELASLIDVNRATANLWERGKTKPKEDKIPRLEGLTKMGKQDLKKLLAEKNPPRAQKGKG